MRVLVVEDEHRIANSIKKGLEIEGYAVDVMYEGMGGLDLAMGEEYDAIILDVMLPGMSGIDICTELRKASVHTPILMLTAKGQINDKVTGLNSGADDYLTKPFAFEELIARIRALTRRPKEQINTILETYDLKMDPTRFEVTKDKHQIKLTSKEFALLEYLLRNKGRVMTKEQIISHVWNYEANILPNTIEVYIKKLREKIGGVLIETVRGFGYRIK